MAPIKPKRPTARARVARSAANDPRGKYAPPEWTSTAHTPSADASEGIVQRERDDIGGGDDDGWRLNKKDKRTIKHNTLLSRVRDAGINKIEGKKKRRRPAKKLTTDLEGLAEALPAVDEDEDEWEGVSEDGAEVVTTRRRRRKGNGEGDGKMKMKSLQHRPGAMKKKRALEQGEMERFRRNLALMAAGADTGGGEGSGRLRDETDAVVGQSERWAALRRFIGGTMERDQAFAGE